MTTTSFDFTGPIQTLEYGEFTQPSHIVFDSVGGLFTYYGETFSSNGWATFTTGVNLHHESVSVDAGVRTRFFFNGEDLNPLDTSWFGGAYPVDLSHNALYTLTATTDGVYAAAVPEPAALPMMIVGVVILGMMFSRRRKHAYHPA